jgi:NDP-sugar pyrophosphorylase family protein
MLPVDGMPILERLLRHFVAHGFREFVVVVGYLGDVIESHLQHIDFGDARLRFLREDAPRGNVGALGELRDGDLPVVLAFGDLLTDLDPRSLLAEHVESDSDLTLASHWYCDQLQFGELVVDDGRVLDYREKPMRRSLICSGVLVAAPRAIRQIDSLGSEVGLVDLVRSCIRLGLKVESWHHDALWLDINSEETLQRANELIAATHPDTRSHSRTARG